MSNLPKLKKPKLKEGVEIFVDVDRVKIVESKGKDKGDWNCALDKNTKVVLGELLRKILNGMSSRDLLENARLVSRRWRDDATWILRRRLDSFGASFKFNAGKNSFISFKSKDENPNEENDEENEDEKPVSKLTELFKSFPAQNFPSTHFHFEGGSLDCPQILEFFSAYGENIKKLTVDVRKNPLTRDGALRQKLFKLTPHLESLELIDSDEDASWAEARSERRLAAGILPEVNPGQGPGQLKTLQFSRSISRYSVVQKLLREIQAELSKNCFISFANLILNPNSDLDLNPDILNESALNDMKMYMNINNVLLQLFVFDSNSVRRLEQFADCRLKFKSFSSTSAWTHQSSATDLLRIGKALWKILNSTRETLTKANFTAEPFLLLTRQPFFPGHFLNLKNLGVNFSLHRAKQEVNWDSFANMLMPRSSSNSNSNSNLNPPLWKNLSEVMPSLESVELDLFDGECEPWLPFFEADAQENSTVRKLQIYHFYRREVLGKLPVTFPLLQTLMIYVSLTPPPSAFNSWTNLIHWLFSTLSQEQQNKSESKHVGNVQQGIQMGKRKREETGDKYEPIPGPLANFKFLESLYLQFKSCGGGPSINSIQGKITNKNPSPSTSHKRTDSNSTGCLLSKFNQVKWYSQNLGNNQEGNSIVFPTKLQINSLSPCYACARG